ncbi:hypothetical protein QR680_006035 [Steinernema hermaphroditum]|uniref:Nuclear receptor domain-containing protein n=1 Tax=Steinernema hermaphroditum TaxID=289476 RepID=A0AA39LVV1_9BILA|nr:hypothetical protein QR680_006035 [Steinernema hermaphroditum]
MALPTTSVDTCLVCGAASHGVHFRVISCRACAAFFRRSLEASHLYKCRRLNKNCDVSKNAKHNCRYCRFQKCKRVGMRYQETSTTPPRSPKSNESNGSPVNLPEIIIEDHKVIYDSEPLLAFVKDLLNGPPLPLKTVDGVRYAPLQRFHMAFNQHLFDGERPTVISDVKFMKLTMIMREMENVIQRSAKFLMSCEEFVELPKNDKWRLYRQFTSNVMCIVRAVATVEFFGCDLEDKRIMYTEDSCIFSDNVDYDTEQISPSTAETLRNVFRPLCTNLYKKVVSPCKQLQITKFETAYILAAILWNTDEIDDVSVETQEAADRFMSEAASEMHHYYRFEMKMENYAERLSKLIKMINAIEKIATQRREMFTLLNMFDMFSCSLFKSDTFF